jgi:hypothetical protein
MGDKKSNIYIYLIRFFVSQKKILKICLPKKIMGDKKSNIYIYLIRFFVSQKKILKKS